MMRLVASFSFIYYGINHCTLDSNGWWHTLDVNMRFSDENQKPKIFSTNCTHFTWFTKYHCHGNKGFHSIRSWTEIFSAFSNIQSWRWIDSSALKCMILDTFAPFYCHHAENPTVLITTFRWNWSAQYFADPNLSLCHRMKLNGKKYSNLSPCL